MSSEFKFGKNRKDPLDFQIASLSKDQLLELTQAFAGIRNLKERMQRLKLGMAHVLAECACGWPAVSPGMVCGYILITVMLRGKDCFYIGAMVLSGSTAAILTCCPRHHHPPVSSASWIPMKDTLHHPPPLPPQGRPLWGTLGSAKGAVQGILPMVGGWVGVPPPPPFSAN